MIYLIIAIISIIAGLLGTYAGAENTSKAWRRFGVPTLILLFALCFSHSWWLISIMFMSFSLSIGYGLPEKGDKGSFLGRFWVDYFQLFYSNKFMKQFSIERKTNEGVIYEGYKITKSAEILTRTTIGSVIVLSLLVIPILNGNWLQYFLSGFTFVLINVIFGGNAIVRNEETFTIFGKMLLWEEFIIYGFLMFLTGLMII